MLKQSFTFTQFHWRMNTFQNQGANFWCFIASPTSLSLCLAGQWRSTKVLKTWRKRQTSCMASFPNPTKGPIFWEILSKPKTIALCLFPKFLMSGKQIHKNNQFQKELLRNHPIPFHRWVSSHFTSMLKIFKVTPSMTMVFMLCRKIMFDSQCGILIFRILRFLSKLLKIWLMRTIRNLLKKQKMKQRNC